MGEYTAYYIPLEQDKHLGSEEEVAEKFWKLGVFLETAAGTIMARRKRVRWMKFRIPRGQHKFSYGGMGLHDGEEGIVPNYVQDVTCPSCNTDISDDFLDVTDSPDESITSPLLGLSLKCPSCTAITKVKDVNVAEPGFVAAKFYLYVSDIFPDDDWESNFKATVESVLGPCKEIVAWET